MSGPRKAAPPVDLEALIRAEFERVLPALVRGLAAAIAEKLPTVESTPAEPEPLSDFDRARARATLRRLGVAFVDEKGRRR